ncbi:MAG: hypothetical protein HY006_03390 [Candidatus Sungbacteria bacterium]|nr:hypothetical protein [Candidatus Sungbacteria bacterium]
MREVPDSNEGKSPQANVLHVLNEQGPIGKTLLLALETLDNPQDIKDFLVAAAGKMDAEEKAVIEKIRTNHYPDDPTYGERAAQELEQAREDSGAIIRGNILYFTVDNAFREKHPVWAQAMRETWPHLFREQQDS